MTKKDLSLAVDKLKIYYRLPKDYPNRQALIKHWMDEVDRETFWISTDERRLKNAGVKLD